MLKKKLLVNNFKGEKNVKNIKQLTISKIIKNFEKHERHFFIQLLTAANNKKLRQQ